MRPLNFCLHTVLALAHYSRTPTDEILQLPQISTHAFTMAVTRAHLLGCI